MLCKIRNLAALGVVLVAVQPSSAATGDVDFNGTISTSCTIVVVNNGVLVQEPGARRLWTSTGAGGMTGNVTLTTTGYGFKVSSTVPSAWTIKPAADTTPTSFQMLSMGSGATTFSAFGVTPATLNPGVTNMMMTMIATKPVGKRFANGNYMARSTVTCE